MSKIYTMNITLNNNPESFEADVLSISDILKIKNFTFKMLVIKINNNLVSKNEYDSAMVHDGDDVKIIHLISGG